MIPHYPQKIQAGTENIQKKSEITKNFLSRNYQKFLSFNNKKKWVMKKKKNSAPLILSLYYQTGIVAWITKRQAYEANLTNKEQASSKVIQNAPTSSVSCLMINSALLINIDRQYADILSDQINARKCNPGGQEGRKKNI